MSFAAPIVADSVAARAGIGAATKAGATKAAGATKVAGGGATRAELGTLSKRLLGAGADRPTVRKALVERGSSAAEADAILAEVAPQPLKPPSDPENSPNKENEMALAGVGPRARAAKASPQGRRRPPARASVPAPTLTPPRGASGWSSADGAGFLMGLVLFAIGTSYLRYGPAGVRAWFGAKFVNRVDPVIAAGEAARGIAPKARPTAGSVA